MRHQQAACAARPQVADAVMDRTVLRPDCVDCVIDKVTRRAVVHGDDDAVVASMGRDVQQGSDELLAIEARHGGVRREASLRELGDEEMQLEMQLLGVACRIICGCGESMPSALCSRAPQLLQVVVLLPTAVASQRDRRRDVRVERCGGQRRRGPTVATRLRRHRCCWRCRG